MQEFRYNQRVMHETGIPGTVTEVHLYPDGDLHYYVVTLDDGRVFECAYWELQEF